MAMASPPTTGLKALNAKHYIMAALMVTVAAAVVVTVFFVVLSPARITFSVTKASSYHLAEEDGAGLNLTLAADNASHRAAVKYQSLFAEVANSTGSELLYSTRAKMNTTDMSQWHPHGGSAATVDAAVSLLGESWKAFFAGDDMVGGATSLVVQVTAAARFKIAGIRTRLYDITVRCGPITFEFVSQSPGAPPIVGCSPV